MGKTDITPTDVEIRAKQANRFGCVIQAMQSFIQYRLGINSNDKVSCVLFNNTADIIFENNVINANLASQLYQKALKGDTFYLQGVAKAGIILEKTRDTKFTPTIIFLSDGEDNSKNLLDKAVSYFKSTTPDCIADLEKILKRETFARNVFKLHAIQFGGVKSQILLQQMADAGGGRYLHNKFELDSLLDIFIKIAEDMDIIGLM